MFIRMLQFLAQAIPFILLCLAARKANLNKIDRGRQVLMPFIALLYCTIVAVILTQFHSLLIKIMGWISGFLPFLSNAGISHYMNLFNLLIVVIFLVLKGIFLPILNKTWKSKNLMQLTSGNFYEYEEDLDKWLLKKEYEQVKTYCNGIYYAALGASVLIFVLGQMYPKMAFAQTPCYPVFGVLVLGEVINYLSGISRTEFIEDVLGEDEESFKVANYGLLKDILKDLFGERVLYDATVDSGLDASSSFETLEEMKKSENQAIRNLAGYFTKLKESGQDVEPNYVKSCVNLIGGQSTLFCNPFYRDLTHYLMFPIMGQLMRYKKCLVIMGRDSATEDVKEWLEQGIFENVNTSSLWKVGVLENENPEIDEPDIGILKFSDLYNLRLQRNHSEFLSRVGFVFIVEPSRLLASGQAGVSLLVHRFDESKEPVVYAACDRNCDGLVDALSHVLKTTITEVTATLKSAATTSIMCWKTEGDYMHHRIFSNVSRYLGMGTEINAVALKYQIANTKWISSEKFPVMDMKWIAGQYYKKICNYTDLPVSQESFNRAFHVESNLWNTQREENSFLVVEDEFQNLFELTRLFATRGTQQGFINVISENYLLRDYMLGNAQTFISDPKAIPTIVADYARTERNTILKLIMRMAEEQVSEDEIVDALMVSGIKFEDPLAALKNLIYKHCFIKEINIRIYFREQLMEDALHTEVKKYYAIEEETEIAEYAKKLQNAYYIAEDEQGDKYYIGAKLYGHVFQALIPGQFLTYDGKYYEVQAITPQNGVVVRRAADHITDRVYYRQLRHIRINDWKDDENIGGQKSVEGISIYKGYCEIDIETAGYLEMTSYENLNAAKEVRVSGIPVRSYRNKLVMKLNLPDVSERVRYTLCLLLNEIFRTIYPDAYPYICAVTLVDTNHAPEKLKGAMYTLSGKVDGSAIYIVEDSEIDLGLIASVERNLKRYFEIITEVLMWHEQKMAENPEKESKPEDYETPFTPEAGKEEEAAKKAREKAEKENKRFLGKIKRKLRKFWEKITAGFKKKPKDEPVEETPTEETPIEETPEEGISEDSPTEETTSTEKKPSGEEKTSIKEEPSTGEELPSEETTSTDERNTETGTENVMKNVMYSAEAEMDIEGEDEQLVEQKTTKKTEYQKSCFLKYGYEEIDPYFDFGGTIKYLTKYGYDRNPLQQVRDGVKAAEADNAKYDPHKEGSHFCDFCGVELAGGEYELLKDGRERCNHCSSTALRTGEEFKEVYKMVVRNMEIFFGIKLNVAIKVRMTDAKTIAKHFGDEFVATPGFDGRVLGFAQKDSSGYSLYIENGSPKLAAMATIAHELTHIWQYQNWDEKMILSKYGKQYRLEIYEGMAKWAEIQYLLYLNEISYAKRQEIVTRLRDDEYGRGFIQYAKKYPLAYRHEKNATPFGRIPPL